MTRNFHCQKQFLYYEITLFHPQHTETITFTLEISKFHYLISERHSFRQHSSTIPNLKKTHFMH